jgi:transcription initiation factor TFIID subunit 11
MHPLRQTSFPAGSDIDSRAYSDAGSVTGSFTGSLGGASAATGEGIFAAGGKKRGRKKKADKEREDAGSARGGLDGRSTRMGSADYDGSSVRGGAAGGAGGDDVDEDEDLDDEGELLGGDEGPTDTEAEKKNLA